MKNRKIWYTVAICLLLLCGCAGSGQKEPAAHRVVVRIEVSGILDQQPLQLHYTAPEKMGVILNYLRLLRQRGNAYTDPEQLPGNSYTITLHLSDGTRQVYRQHADRFLSKDNAPWRYVRQDHAEYLGLILQSMPGDGS